MTRDLGQWKSGGGGEAKWDIPLSRIVMPENGEPHYYEQSLFVPETLHVIKEVKIMQIMQIGFSASSSMIRWKKLFISRFIPTTTIVWCDLMNWIIQ